MSKTEDLAKEFLRKVVSHTTLYKGTIDELEVYEPDDVIGAYQEGYQQAEKDIELTWKDMSFIRLAFDATEANIHLGNIKVNPMTKEYYQEVLKRFKELKK